MNTYLCSWVAVGQAGVDTTINYGAALVQAHTPQEALGGVQAAVRKKRPHDEVSTRVDVENPRPLLYSALELTDQTALLMG